MSAIVDYTYYTETYVGTEADEASFPALCARAEDVIGGMTHWWVDENSLGNYPAKTRELYRKAICAQIDFLALNGVEVLSDAGGGGFTVGKVSVQAWAAANGGGALRAAIAPRAIGYLEQTGLMNPQVDSLEGWW